MHIPRNDARYSENYDDEYSQRAEQAAAARAHSNSPDSESDDLAGQLAELRLGRSERRRASDAAAALAPRGAGPELGSSMRLPASSVASLVSRERQIHSARYDLPRAQESSPAEPCMPCEAARHSSAYAAYTARFDTAPRRKGGFMSGIQKGVKGLKHAFGFGGSRRDSSIHRGPTSSTFRMDAPSPELGLPGQTHDEAVDAQVIRHHSPPLEAQEGRATRRRPGDPIRRLAASAMNTAETALPPPERDSHPLPHDDDLQLIARAQAGLAVAIPPIPRQTAEGTLRALVGFSAWLKQHGVDKRPMNGRLFSEDLMSDAQKYRSVGGHPSAPAALQQLRDMESSHAGVMNIPRRPFRKGKAVPDSDQRFIAKALGTHIQYRAAAESFSEWLAQQRLPMLTGTLPAEDGIERPALHSELMTGLAERYAIIKLPNGKKLPNAKNVPLALRQLRIFDTTGHVAMKKQSSHLGIPEVDERLTERYRNRGNALYARKRAEEGLPVKKPTQADATTSRVRAFSDWLKKTGRPPIAGRVGDPSLAHDLDLFVAENGSGSLGHIRSALKTMQKMFPPEDPMMTFGRIGHHLFIQALGTLARTPDMSVTNAAIKLGAGEDDRLVDDLLVFLDAAAEDGLTEAGRALVQTFDGRALQAAQANIALRQQEMEKAKAMQDEGLAPAQAVSPLVATPVGWSQISWSDDAPALGTEAIYGGLSSLGSDARFAGHGPYAATPSEIEQPVAADSFYDDLSSINSAHHQGGFAFHLNAPSEEAQRELTDSAYAGLSPFASVSGYGAPGSNARTSSEVTGPYRPAPEVVEVDDYPSPPAEGPSVAQRLAHDPWLRSDDLWTYSESFLESFARELGPGGLERINQMLTIGDPPSLEQLMNGDARRQAAARKRLTAPILLLPVNRATQNHRDDHWSLLVIHRAAQQACHYDSMIPPRRAHEATATPQFAIACQMASALGISRVSGMPTAQQRDGHSCGDHVLAGIEALARRIVTPQGEFSWDLSDIRPSREHIVDALVRHEQATQQRQGAEAGGTSAQAWTAPPAAHHQAEEIGPVVGEGWRHGPQFLPDILIGVLAHRGLLPSQYMPQTTFYIHGQPYAATLDPGMQEPTNANPMGLIVRLTPRLRGG